MCATSSSAIRCRRSSPRVATAWCAPISSTTAASISASRCSPWQKWREGATPESTGKKGDHLIGDFYVAFDKHYRAEVKELMESQGLSKEEAEAASPLMAEARAMLRAWEARDPEVRALLGR